MRVLVTYGSQRGGTEGIAHLLADELASRGFQVEATPADEVSALGSFDAVIIGGALYANRWPGSVRRFVRRNLKQLRRVPVWLFSSGPLDDSAERGEIPPSTQVAVLAERIGAQGHRTFGGRLRPDARGFPASAMARTRSGDWRNPDRIRAWAAELSTALPGAVPGEAVDHPGHALVRLVVYGVAGWAACAAVMLTVLLFAGLTTALVAHGVVAPLVFGALAWLYFRCRGSRGPLETAAVWTGLVLALDLGIVAGAVQGSLEMFASVLGAWLPLALIFAATSVTGWLMEMRPLPRAAEGEPRVGAAPELEAG